MSKSANFPVTNPEPKQISQDLLTWWDQHGRKDLPWQQNKTAYSVWLSEIMLQQTQVKTVIPYYQTFLQQFPTVSDLANASEDQVLKLWAGLGYYARARNLHKTAKTLVREYNGQFPDQADVLEMLPGIGRSTAGAIAASAFNQHNAILDGNVKRVLTRIYAIEEWPGSSQVTKLLWHISEAETPEQRTADYNQSIMDLGASLCSRTKPKCGTCPLQNYCEAYKQELTHVIPAKKVKKQNPSQTKFYLIAKSPIDEILLVKRSSVGIWGGLYSLPEFSSLSELESFVSAHQSNFDTQPLAQLNHKFSHFDLMLQPVVVAINQQWPTIAETETIWTTPKAALTKLGLPTPIKRIISSL